MMSVLGVTFSMTLVALALASSQYTSRILRNFMRSRVTQSTLGIFAGIFTYCLIVLRTIRGGDEGAFVPNLAVFFAFILALGGVGVLIFFIHHIASSIQASSIIASVADETVAAVDRWLPEQRGSGPDDDEDQAPRLPEGRSWRAVPAEATGYIQSVDSEALLCLARDRNTIVRMERGIGGFVVHKAALASLALERLAGTGDNHGPECGVRHQRPPHGGQDRVGVRQIVDIALKALSPGVNDTSTAVMCVDYLTAILARVASRRFPVSRRYDGGDLRLIAVAPTFEDLLAGSFDQIRRNAEGNVAVLTRMLGALETIGALTVSPRRRRALGEHVRWIAELADRTVDSAHDLEGITRRLMHVREGLESGPVAGAGET